MGQKNSELLLTLCKIQRYSDLGTSVQLIITIRAFVADLLLYEL